MTQRTDAAASATTARRSVRLPSVPSLAPERLAALRAGRATLMTAARADEPCAVVAAVGAYVRAMLDVGFAPGTVPGLVASALEMALPNGRGPARRARRARRIAAAVGHARALLDPAADPADPRARTTT